MGLYVTLRGRGVGENGATIQHESLATSKCAIVLKGDTRITPWRAVPPVLASAKILSVSPHEGIFV